MHVAQQWWELGNVPALDKDRALYRTWTDAIPGALAEETRLFLAAAWQGKPNLTTLLTAPFTFVDADLASFYNLPAPGGGGFQRVDLDPTRAAGLLTQGAFLAEHAKADQTSPVLRGKFVRAKLFCTTPPPPPPDIVVMAPTRRSAFVDAPALRAAHRRRSAAPGATCRWIRSASRSSTTTPPGAGVTSTPDSRSTRRAC